MPDRRTTSASLAEQFRLLSDTLYATNDIDGALGAVVRLATRTIDHCNWAGISQTTGSAGEGFVTLAASDPVVRTADRLQIELQEGPGIDLVGVDTGFLSDDLGSVTRWPRFSAAVRAATPIRSVLSLAIHPAPVPAALTLYSAAPRAFSVETVDAATLFAAHAQVLLLLVRQSDRIGQLTDALTTSRLIGNAVGILMFAHRISSAEASGRLTRASQFLHRRLSDLAGEVTDTGSLPRATRTSRADGLTHAERPARAPTTPRRAAPTHR